jgi:hypothetical protein
MADHNSDFWPNALVASSHSKQATSTVLPVTALVTPTGTQKQKTLEESPYSTLSHPTAVKPT